MKHYLKNNKKTFFIVGRGIGDYIITEDCETGYIHKILISDVENHIDRGAFQLCYVSSTSRGMDEVPFAEQLDLNAYFKK